MIRMFDGKNAEIFQKNLRMNNIDNVHLSLFVYMTIIPIMIIIGQVLFDSSTQMQSGIIHCDL